MNHRRPRPLLPSFILEPALRRLTDEQQADALQETERVLRVCRDMCSALGLPLELVGTAAEIYSNNVMAIRETAVAASEAERYKKQERVHELRQQREPRKGRVVDQGQGPFGYDPMRGLMSGVSGACDDVCEMDTEQLDAELARLESLPRSVP